MLCICINVVCQVKKHMINEEVMACYDHSEETSISSCVDWPSSSSLVYTGTRHNTQGEFQLCSYSI